MNAQHLAFPDGEKFFIRSVKAFADVYKNDPELKNLELPEGGTQ